MQRTSHHLEQLMASFSFSSITPKLEYDIFLSFRGVDTRTNIVSHLYEAFSQKKIKTFIDDYLYRGEEISPSLLRAIEHSKISVIIFSKGYASSVWCLKELEKIVECKNTYDQIVIPVFHEVDPSDVRNQTGDFGKAFAELEKCFMDDSEMLLRWRTALRDAANLHGYDSKKYWTDSQLLKEIVEDIVKRLRDMSPKYELLWMPESESQCWDCQSLVWRPEFQYRDLGVLDLSITEFQYESQDLRSKSESQGWRFLSVFFLVMEAISVVFDVYGKSKKNFLLAAFVLSAFGFIITIHAFIRKRRTAAYRQKPVRELAWVEVAFSVLQLVTLFIQYILAVARVKNSYSPSLFPLVFVLLVVVFAFKKQNFA
ncbi:disease resistance protein RPS6-like [Mangifera indica]|uniref:disease resistance protein RPS6-like n=1 Tax=Mangifera indica TaxID=29780 RepID=UPI001CFB7C88|nr:disease resistance protein RPS6-like [Mangifera indica]